METLVEFEISLRIVDSIVQVEVSIIRVQVHSARLHKMVTESGVPPHNER